MTRAKKKTFATLVGLAVVGFVVDRALRSGAAPAPAAAAESMGDASAGASREILAKSPPVAVAPFPENLPAAMDAADARDPFDPSPVVLARLLSPEQAVARRVGRGATARDPAASFSDSHSLSAVLRIGGSWLAVVNGLVLTEGQRLDDCELVGIEARTARFRCEDGEFILSLQDPM